MTRKTRIILTSMGILALAAAEALASGGGGEGGGSMWKAFMWQVINFAIIASVLVYFGRKPIRNMFVERTEEIERGIAEAKAASENAEKALAEVERRFAAKDAEIKAMIEAAEARGKQERDALIIEGERMAKRVLEQAKSGIEMELAQAKAGLKAEAVQYAMELAEKKISGSITPDDQKRLFEEALKRLEERS